MLQLFSSQKWTKAYLPLIKRTDYYQIYLQTNASFKDDVRVRNIEFIGCSKFENNMDCNFNDDNCQWNMSSLNGQWQRNQGLLLDSIFGPLADRKDEFGYYLYFKPDHDSLTSYASLTSNVIYGYCFNFWYFMNGHSIGSILVDVFNETEWINIWKRSRSKGEIWHPAYIVLPFKSTYLQIRIENNQKMAGVVAVDDFKILAGSCKPKVCDFETDFCLWEPIVNKSSTWEITRFNKRNDLLKGLADHSTETVNGNFVYILNPNAKHSVKLRSILHTDDSAKCFIFWYTSCGEIGNLSVKMNFFTHQKLIWSKSSNHHQIWRKAEVNIQKGSNYAIEIEATFTTSNQGFFAVDDLLISNQPCSTKIACDFETDTCGWSSDNAAEGNDWIRVNHFVLNQKDKEDVSIQTSQGYFLYALFEKGTTNREITIQSHDFAANERWCFSFWYNFENSGNVTLHLEALDDSTKMHSILVINSSITDEWVLEKLQIESIGNNLNQNDFQVLQFRASRNDLDVYFGSRVAIKLDELKFTKGQCRALKMGPETFPSVSIEDYSTVKLSFAQLTCDFEKDTCGWISLIPNLWKTFNSIELERITHFSPQFDSTFLSRGRGHFAAFMASKQHNQAIFLSKNFILSSELSSGGCLEFRYYMNGDFQSLLSLQYLVDNNAFALWQRSGPFLFWDFAYVNIPALKAKIYLQFEAKTQPGHVIGLDDIDFTPGSCKIVGPCTFENDNCGFRNLELDRGWVRKTGFIQSFDNIPTDRTMQTSFGNYLHLESSTLFKLNEPEGTNVSVASVRYPNSFGCLSFSSYYYGDGHNIGEFKILTRDALTKSQILLYKSEGDDDLWRDVQIEFEGYFDNFELIFQATLGPHYQYTKLGLDNIQIKYVSRVKGTIRVLKLKHNRTYWKRLNHNQLSFKLNKKLNHT